MSKKECRKLVCVLALSLLMAMPGNGIAQMASASNSITTLSVEKNEQDVAVLQKIIATQSGKNTTISENLNDSKQYTGKMEDWWELTGAMRTTYILVAEG